MAADISLDAAEKVVQAAKKKAAEIKTLTDIAVVDAGGNLKAFRGWTGPGWEELETRLVRACVLGPLSQ
jgi:uncharacterized protein GlcG (DUF336 family)